ncbi:sensor histidine kinase [Faunimonas pinastri]|nr:HAMP domain-containing sensor histidine kinase [Faunimonas pinastri]
MRALIGDVRVLDHPRNGLFHFEQEMAAQFATDRQSSALIIPALILVMGVAIGLLGNPRTALVWATVMLLTHAYALQGCRRLLRELPDSKDVADARRRFVRRDLAYGLCWAAFPLLIPQSASMQMAGGLEIVRLAAVIVVLAIGALLSSTIPAAAVAATLPITLCMALAHMIDPNFFNVMIALCTLGAEILFLHLSSHLYSQHVQTLSYRAEKDALFAELEQSKAVSEEARRRAEASNNAKSQFLATMSHELRTPLNAILGFSELMRSEMLGPVGNAAYQDYLDDIHNSGQHLLKIINEILDLSRIEAGKRELNEELISLVAVTRDAHSLLELHARNKNIRVLEVYDRAMPKIVVDEQAIRQIVLNLMSNALKFTPTDGEITVKVGRTQAGGQYISVRDNGPGIPENEIPVVLSAFGQSSVSIKNAEQGTGLGIPIVQALVDLHGGNFTLRSQLGVGTEAIVTLPAKRVVSPFAPAVARPARREEPKRPNRLRMSA